MLRALLRQKFFLKTPLLSTRSFSLSKIGVRYQHGPGVIGYRSSDAQLISLNLDEKYKPKKIDVIKQLTKFLWPNSTSLRARTVIALTLLLCGKILNVQIPYLFKYIVDIVNTSLAAGNLPPLSISSVPVLLLIGYGSVRVTSALFNELRSTIFMKVTQSSISHISLEVFKHLHQLDLKFHINRNMGALTRTLDRGTRGINFILNSFLFNIIPTIFEIILVSYILTTHFSPVYTGITLSSLAIYLLYTFRVTSWRTKFRKVMNLYDNAASSRVFESLVNFDTVKYFNNEALEYKRYQQNLMEYNKAQYKISFSLFLLNFGQNFIFNLGLASTMLLSVYDIYNGVLSVGDLIMVNGLLFQLSIPLNFIGTMYREINQSFVDLEQMMSLHNIQPTIKDAPDAAPLFIPRGKGKIIFDNVCFAYEDKREILNNLSFSIDPTKNLAIVGSSGSGKSTIIRLIYRFFDPLSGRIYIDNHDISKITLNSLRRSIGIVPQDTVLFNESLYYNILYGNAKASQEEVFSVAKAARIHELATRLPEGYDTKVGERGLKLSGGERQRIAIARMLLKNPSIILCDEATSSLDSKTESEILSALRQNVAGKTSLFIAHRLSTIKDCNEILVLDNGRCRENGTHEELISNPNSLYSEMWQRQLFQEGKDENTNNKP